MFWEVRDCPGALEKNPIHWSKHHQRQKCITKSGGAKASLNKTKATLATRQKRNRQERGAGGSF